MMSEAKFFEGYSRWDEERGRYETWDEAVERVMNMHREFYADKMSDELADLIGFSEDLYKQKMFLGAQRALQFGGDQLIKHQMRLFNCLSGHVDRPEFFGEYFYCLLAGCGYGAGVQKHYIAKLPEIQNRTKQAKIFTVPDSIEGWAQSLDVLLSSYFVGGGKHCEYEGRRVFFDTSLIRDKGSIISGGFKAPGAEPLRKALDKIEHLLQGLVLKGITKLRPIHVYDICMHIADAVLSGGVRRAATIFMFSFDDEEMMNAKTGNWFYENPQRARSNNSAVAVKNKITREQFATLMKRVREFGEPGFIFVDSDEFTFNPCCEIGMYPFYIDENGEKFSGSQGCNLCEINGGAMTSEEIFYETCRAAAIVGTLQAGYTNFKFVSDVTKKIFEREALIGVSITGWMNNPDILFNEKVLKKGAEIVKKTNEKIAKMIGINPAARTTTTKPSGNASVILKTASGIHGEHYPSYLRNVQMNKDTEVAQLIKKTNPYMVEESIWSSSKSDYIISFPIIAPKESVWKEELYGTKLLEKVKHVQQTWVEYGTNEEYCVDPRVRHNVSNTVEVLPNQWEEVEQYIFDNRQYFAGISMLSATGDKDYHQAPFISVDDEQQIIEKYGRGAIFASGLIVDATNGFDNLWDAVAIANQDEDRGDKEKADVRADWVRRWRKYCDNYFDGDTKTAEYCLKAVYLLHKWTKIQDNYVDVNFVDNLEEKKYVDADTISGESCHGGACEVI